MLPIDSVTGALWSSKNANLKLADIRRCVVQELRQRDEVKSEGLLCEANGWKTTMVVGATETIDEDGTKRTTPGKLVADPRLVAIKHSGADVTTLTNARWATFHSEPRDEKAETAHLIEAQRGATIGVTVAAAASLEKELSEVEVPPVRRPPGRPKGTKNKVKGVEHGCLS